jgi:AmmeMemoRadiSam system protein B
MGSMVRGPVWGIKTRLVEGRCADTIAEMANCIREPVVAGAFYPAHREQLVSAVTALIGEDFTPKDEPLPEPVGLIVPHAGYLYSGGVAGTGFRAVATSGRPEVAIVLGANHTGRGHPVSLAAHTAWRTPLGEVPLALGLVDELHEAGLATDDSAFAREHSIEVQLPFLQVLWGDSVPIVPICVGLTTAETLSRTGRAMAETLTERSALVVASSDFTHYEPDEMARRTDRAALDRILALDIDGFLEKCQTERLSICGAGAIAVLMAYALECELTQVRLLTYATSGDATGDRSSVVGYASVTFTRESHDT